MIRLILICILLLIIFILSIILFPVEWIIGKFSPHARDISSLRFIQFVFKIILFISGVNTTVIGFENIPEGEPVVFVGNHRGFFDVIVSYSRMPGLTGFFAKKEMNKVPFIRVWMRLLYCLFLDRSNPKEGLKTILKGVEQLKCGISVVIFPEGTRNKGDGVQPFHGGSFKLAEKSNCKIIPMVQNNTENVFEAHFPLIKRTHTILEFGKPVDVAALDRDARKALPDTVHGIISEIYEKNKSLV